MLAKDIMTKEVITVKKEDTVEDVIKLLLEHNISGVPVVNEENNVVGMITEGDLIYRSKELHIPAYFTLLDSYIFLENPKTLEVQIKKMAGYLVKDVMTEKVIVVDQEETMEEIATIMVKKKINRVPVVKDHQLVGIVSRRDIIRAYAGQ
ncbi:CBS domain-containing protein [Clostridium aceticum]|uniref:CBS domain-containing protein n=1 Tax=Clostridium aceticum TaxID=84022 RepID=A0A0D8IB89_9CLOT|nr:CBS domain-containing protein [Clostridium aceticum]AKL96782.1 CBS domain-containing protein [Clostridium aceticum]KJF27538.1 membrane protein [Clostridium aceticum]